MSYIKNLEDLTMNGPTQKDKNARRSILLSFDKAIASVDPYKSVSSRISDNSIFQMNKSIELSDFEEIFVIGAGKASGMMAKAVEDKIERISEGWVNVPAKTEKLVDLSKIRLNPAGHPIPDEGSINGAREMLRILSKADEKDLVIVLISGGGSALMEYPMEGITLEDLREMNRLLVLSGADIREINTVRKHVSRVKGGRLAEAAYPARVVSLIISDVIGDPLDTIASGPTAPDETTFQDAWEVLRNYSLVERMPQSIIKVIKDGVEGRIPETPKPGDPIFENVTNMIVANNLKAVQAAEGVLRSLGYSTLVLGSRVQGEARHIGKMLAGLASSIRNEGIPLSPPAALLMGGETTVTVTGKGVGGRNQELVLGAVRQVAGLDGVAIASIGTDGIDGTSEAAGAICDGHTLERALSEGLKPEEYLKNNDSYSFFSWLGDAIITGPTLTNVMDLMGVVVED
ncbi:glycerate kinase type-2 family protein [Candidatus Korarchaeum cryptofilum]|uniref:glycerate 2-kinase n=1 Tax=Korarchaeum cryptofilum (strain OPF8) TaxID=374847 RepID=B1L6E4_KORCO|nr:glycerate kinase [Candidatus Korarchaeum cryptofilum]ACB08023.1 Hydroxypyruvate reductase [Candidatus Korarchaeum cryptofilum OPF8]